MRKGEVDVLVMDLSMPDQSGVDALAAIKARAPGPAGADPERLSRRALRDDAAAPGRERLPQQGMRPEEIVKAIRTVYRGRKYITAGGRRAAGRQARRRRRQAGARAARPSASSRSSCGWPRARRSATWPTACRSSVKTVSTYRTRVMEKMKLESNSDLTYYALKNGLIQ